MQNTIFHTLSCSVHSRMQVVIMACICFSCAKAGASRPSSDLFPALEDLCTTRPRVLLRPSETPYAVSVRQLRSTKKDKTFKQVIRRLKGRRNAAAKALVWLCTGDEKQAREAVSLLTSYRCPEKTDTFHMYFKLMYMGLAYDWLWHFPGFTERIKKQVRANVTPLAERALAMAHDHMFHNYIWMSAGGLAVWAFATAGEDANADIIFKKIRKRFNAGLFPAWNYLDGLPSEPMGYWSLYVLAPGFFTLLAGQSAAETDCIERAEHFLSRHVNNLVHSVLPNLRYLPWGDLQGGPNGGVTHEMAGFVDAATWALGSPYTAFLSRRIKEARGLSRFYGETAMWYLIYSRSCSTEPAKPPLTFQAGGRHSGHFITRGDWSGSATVVSLTATDHFGDHHHYDQGSFIIYRRELLAVDPPVYRKIRGPQQRTGNHNTLLFAGKGQRRVRGQWFVTVDDFVRNLEGGRRLETGTMLYAEDHGDWSAAAVQIAQAYDEKLVESVVRQLLFIRPSTVVVVDRIKAADRSTGVDTTWLLHVPKEPSVDGISVEVEGKHTRLHCTSLFPGKCSLKTERTDVNTYRCCFHYPEAKERILAHLMQTGDASDAPGEKAHACSVKEKKIVFRMDGKGYLFDKAPGFCIGRK